VDDRDWLAQRFEQDRLRLRGVAYRMLGSLAEAEDAVQEAWLRLARSDADAIENLSGWLTTVVGRVCLDMLRSRRARREEPLEVHVPDPIVEPITATDPEQEALLADSVGLALLLVLDTLTPAARLAFVLHDMFDVPFADIAQLLDRSTDATKMLASRARRRLRETPNEPDTDLDQQHRIVNAFFAAARAGDFEALVGVLAPDVVLRAEGGPGRPHFNAFVRGAEAVAGRAMSFANPRAVLHPALVNGSAGVVVTVNGRPFSIMSFTVSGGRIVAIDGIADPDRMAACLSASGLELTQ
jgi:RNA polymerase sigma-70 factor (ECF subfamily)